MRVEEEEEERKPQELTPVSRKIEKEREGPHKNVDRPRRSRSRILKDREEAEEEKQVSVEEEDEEEGRQEEAAERASRLMRERPMRNPVVLQKAPNKFRVISRPSRPAGRRRRRN